MFCVEPLRQAEDGCRRTRLVGNVAIGLIELFPDDEDRESKQYRIDHADGGKFKTGHFVVGSQAIERDVAANDNRPAHCKNRRGNEQDDSGRPKRRAGQGRLAVRIGMQGRSASSASWQMTLACRRRLAGEPRENKVTRIPARLAPPLSWPGLSRPSRLYAGQRRVPDAAQHGVVRR